MTPRLTDPLLLPWLPDDLNRLLAAIMEASSRTPTNTSRPMLAKAICRRYLILKDMAREIPVMKNVRDSVVLIAPERVALEAAKARKGTLHKSIHQVVKEIEVSPGKPASASVAGVSIQGSHTIKSPSKQASKATTA